MRCPEEYRNQSIEIKSSVKNHGFFSSNSIDHWTFKDFLVWTKDSTLRRLKSHYNDYKNSLNSLSIKVKMDRELLNYVQSLKTEECTDNDLKEIKQAVLQGYRQPNNTITITNSVVTDSNVFTAEGSVSLPITSRKRKNQDDSHTISIKKNKEIFNLIKPITRGTTMSLDNPAIEDITRATIEKVAFIKLNQADHCENDATVTEYEENTSNSLALSSIRNVPMALQFLENALKQDIDDLLTWLGTNGFNSNYSNCEKQAILFIRLVLTDFYVNCYKPTLHNTLNERTPFVEYLVPVFKCFSAVFKRIAFQWCEKGLESNKCCGIFSSDGKKRLADGVGYVLVDNTERVIIESSGENNETHKEEDSIKLLECSVRTLKLEMEKLECASFDTYKKRKVLSFLYTNDKITMLTTGVADENHWSFIKVREARIPRRWEARHQWLKVFELMLYTNEMLVGQQVVSEELLVEESGWTQVPSGKAIHELSRTYD